MDSHFKDQDAWFLSKETLSSDLVLSKTLSDAMDASRMSIEYKAIECLCNDIDRKIIEGLK